jgi:hypothetical protein
MIATARYLLAELTRSRRFVAPLLLLAAGVIVLYAQPPNPVLATAGTVAAFLFPAHCWLAFTYFNSQSAPDRHVLAATVGGRAYVSGRMLAAGALMLIVSLAGLLVPLAFGAFERTPTLAECALIVLANLVTTGAGTALAAPFAQPLMRSRVVSVLGLAACALLTIPLGLSPAVATAQALDTTHAAAVPSRIAGDLLGVAIFAVAVALVCARQWRRSE